MKIAAFIAAALALCGAATPAQTIRAVTEDSSFTFMQNGKVAGSASEVVEATLQRAGLTDYRLALYPWARAYDMARQEPNVLIYLIGRTPEREKLFKWTGEFMRIDYYFYKLRERKDIVVHSLQDAKGYSIGVMRDDLRQQYLQSQGFTKLVVSAENADNFRMLLNRQVQLVPMPEHDVAVLCAEAHVDCALLDKIYALDGLSMGLYMAYSNATPDETVARTRAAFDKLKADGSVARLMHTGR